MRRIWTAGVAAALLALSACGGGSDRDRDRDRDRDESSERSDDRGDRDSAGDGDDDLESRARRRSTAMCEAAAPQWNLPAGIDKGDFCECMGRVVTEGQSDEELRSLADGRPPSKDSGEVIAQCTREQNGGAAASGSASVAGQRFVAGPPSACSGAEVLEFVSDGRLTEGGQPLGTWRDLGGGRLEISVRGQTLSGQLSGDGLVVDGERVSPCP